MQDAAVAIFFYMTVLFVIAAMIKDNSIADIAWGWGFILVSLVALLKNGNYIARPLLTSGLVLIWGLRLSIHIFFRHLGKGEDRRYRAWREEWGSRVLVNSFFRVFMLQGLLLLGIAYPMVQICAAPGSSLTFLDMAGCIFWGAGFTIEALSDYQLGIFKKDPKNRGRLMMTGLWRYSRHPNYFGESLVWTGIALLAMATGAWTALGSPLLITFLLVFLSGIPLVEREQEKNPGFAEYRRKTSAFIPLPPRTH
jgi:steroid 5-alpha reductase family enzyme